MLGVLHFKRGWLLSLPSPRMPPLSSSSAECITCAHRHASSRVCVHVSHAAGCHLCCVGVAVQMVCLGLNAVGTAHFPFLVGTAPDVKINPAIADQPTIFHSAGFALAALFFVRTKYYFGWLVTEGSAVLAGFGYVEKSKSWTGVSNVDVLSFEFATNVSNAAKAWNQVRFPRSRLQLVPCTGFGSSLAQTCAVCWRVELGVSWSSWPHACVRVWEVRTSVSWHPLKPCRYTNKTFMNCVWCCTACCVPTR